MRYRQISESPQMITSVDWKLGERLLNAQKAAALMRLDPKVIKTYEGARLVQDDGEFGGQIGLIDDQTQLLGYYALYEKSNSPSLGSCATQVKVWRSFAAPLVGIAKIVFNDVLLEQFDTLVSDTHHTTRGKDFWTAQISGNARIKTVGVILEDEIKLYPRAEEMINWLATVDGWVATPAFKYRRFFISNLSREAIERAITTTV